MRRGWIAAFILAVLLGAAAMSSSNQRDLKLVVRGNRILLIGTGTEPIEVINADSPEAAVRALVARLAGE